MAIIVKMNFNANTLTAKVDKAWDKGLAILTEEIKNDANEYVKVDRGMLRASSEIHSIPKEGKIIWQTPYAKRQYWAIKTAYQDKNSNATWKWFHVAKSKHLQKWVRKAEKLMEMNL